MILIFNTLILQYFSTYVQYFYFYFSRFGGNDWAHVHSGSGGVRRGLGQTLVWYGQRASGEGTEGGGWGRLGEGGTVWQQSWTPPPRGWVWGVQPNAGLDPTGTRKQAEKARMQLG